MTSILPMHGHGICFHLFVSALISFFCVVWISEYSSFTSLVKLIPQTLILSVAIISSIICFANFCFCYFIVGDLLILVRTWMASQT